VPLTGTSGSVGGLGGRPPRSTRPAKHSPDTAKHSRRQAASDLRRQKGVSRSILIASVFRSPKLIDDSHFFFGEASNWCV
jgi:hypothetical protein